MLESNNHIKKRFSQNLSYSSALEVLRCIEDRGFECWFAGGSVRDALLNRSVKDFDLTTEALPDQIIEIFGLENCLLHGKDFGTVVVKNKGELFEVTTFRSDYGHTQHRKPKKVVFSSKEEDVKRRDFTMNGLLYHPVRGLLDLVKGLDDIQNKVLRTIGNGKLRFEEDALRILRLYRFSLNLDFEIEQTTSQHAVEKTTLLNQISKERIFDELKKTFSRDFSKLRFKEISKLYGYEVDLQSFNEQQIEPRRLLPFRLAYFQRFFRDLEIKDYILEKKMQQEFLFFNEIIENLYLKKIEAAELIFLHSYNRMNFEFPEIKSLWKVLFEIFPSENLQKIREHISKISDSDHLTFKKEREKIIRNNEGIEIQKKIKILEGRFYFNQDLSVFF